jgi:HPt (histidine-containing phosphotransfer) domain-containing protein
MTPDTVTLDPERIALLRELDDGGYELLGALAEEFEHDVREQLDAAGAALEASDAAALGRCAHRLKGAGANLGADTLAAICADVEQHARDADLDAIAPLLAALESELVRVMAALHQILAEA